ncbi:MAG: amidohydrolase family protein, partial [Verrucomicrobiota bacterium]|nr:amidohydrolase family protein [Verrucomicrobiota bacterium]
HLDYTMMRRGIRPQKTFAGWIARINGLKRSLDEDDYLAAIAAGFRELVRYGTTTVLNIESFPELMLRMPPPPIRAWWFYELIDLRKRLTTDALVEGAFSFFEERPGWLGGSGLSPHAPYTASDELYRLVNEYAAAHHVPLTTHIAESAEEDEMFRRGSGPLFDFLFSLGRNMDDCGHGSPLSRMLHEGLLDSNWIVAHLNELDDADIAALNSHPLHIVHCPRSHRYFGHHRFEFQRLHEAGANISLGTDSLASNDSLNLFAEMQEVEKSESWMRPEDLLKTVTTNPARALKMETKLGCLAPGAFADMIALPFSEGSPFEQIIHNQRPVNWMLVNGRPTRSAN